MKKRPDPPISNLILAGVAALFLVTVGVLGGLFYSLRPHKVAVVPAPFEIAAVSATSVKLAADSMASVEPSDDNAPVIRVAMRSDDPAPVPEKAASVEAPKPAEPEPASALAKSEAIPDPPSTLMLPAPSAKDNSNEMVPELKGMSYTAKKALANGGDAYASAKSPVAPAKKVEAKKLAALPAAKIPVKPDAPKPPAAKPEAPKPPALSAADLAKIDFSKAPVYVLHDGRRIRAVVIRDDGITLSVRNEAGTTILFKKTDVKEILRG